jgi:hypothetical protein
VRGVVRGLNKKDKRGANVMVVKLDRDIAINTSIRENNHQTSVRRPSQKRGGLRKKIPVRGQAPSAKFQTPRHDI